MRYDNLFVKTNFNNNDKIILMPRKMKKELPPLKTIDNKTVGERIMEARKYNELTQLELSKKIGITRSLLGDYETGRLNVSAEMLARFALALDVSTDSLLGLKKIEKK